MRRSIALLFLGFALLAQAVAGDVVPGEQLQQTNERSPRKLLAAAPEKTARARMRDKRIEVRDKRMRPRPDLLDS